MDMLDPRPWRLDILDWPEMQVQAAHDIACSDVVVVPVDDACANSAFFRNWAETWPAALDRQRLLLVPKRGIADTLPHLQQFIQWLHELACRKGMDFVNPLVSNDLFQRQPTDRKRMQTATQHIIGDWATLDGTSPRILPAQHGSVANWNQPCQRTST